MSARNLVAAAFTLIIAGCSPSAPLSGVAGPSASKTLFVGRAVCGECHAPELAAFSGSHHDRAMETPGPQTVLGDFSGVRLTTPDLTSQFTQRDGRYLIRTAGADHKIADFPVAYTFGVAPLQQYLLRAHGGRLQAFGAAWDARPAASGGQRWFDLYPDETLAPGNSLHWTGLDQTWNYQCAECHSTNLRKGYDATSREYRTTWSEEDVSCEACHGAGSRHVSWARSGGGDSEPRKGLATVIHHAGSWRWDVVAGKPTKSGTRPAVAEVEACGRCHARRATLTEDYVPGQHLLATHRPALLTEDLYYADGQIRGEVFEYGSFLQSRMAMAGVTCSDCHEPHSLKVRGEPNAVCNQCHLPARYDQQTHTRHATASPASECVNCHMPKRTYMVVDSRRDHSLRIPRPDLTVRLGVPNACTACHADKPPEWAAAAVTSWFGERDYPTHFGETFAAARSGNPASAPHLQKLMNDRAQPAIVRATALVELARFPGATLVSSIDSARANKEPLIRWAAALALEGLPPELRARSGAPLLADSLLGVRVEAAHQLAGVPPGALSVADKSSLRAALADYQSTLQVAADRPEAQLNMGNLQIDRGAYDRAEVAYKEAIMLDPTFAPAYVNLSDVQRAQGSEETARATIELGLARSPDDAGLRHALGLALVRQGDTPAAITQLWRAVQVAPESARYAYVLGVALNDMGQAREALEVLRAAQARHPNDEDILQALTSFGRGSGRTAGVEGGASR